MARISPATAAAYGVTTDSDGDADSDVVLTNDRGELTLPLVVEPGMVDGVVWVPAKPPGLAVAEHLAVLPGDLVGVAVEPRVAESVPRRALKDEPVTGIDEEEAAS